MFLFKKWEILFPWGSFKEYHIKSPKDEFWIKLFTYYSSCKITSYKDS